MSSINVPNPQFPADLVSFTEEILYGRLHFLCSDKIDPCKFLVFNFQKLLLKELVAEDITFSNTIYRHV